jgi:hypothetical protein
MPSRRGKGKGSSEPEFGWQNMALWERSKGDVLFSGYLEVTPEFIEHLLDAVDGDELELTDEGKIKLGVSLRQSSSDKRNAPDLYGSIYELTEKEEEKPKRGRRKVRDDDDDEDDEPPKRGGRTSRSSGRSGRSSSRSSRSR